MPKDIKIHKTNDTIKTINKDVKGTVKGVKSAEKEKDRGVNSYNSKSAKSPKNGQVPYTNEASTNYRPYDNSEKKSENYSNSRNSSNEPFVDYKNTERKFSGGNEIKTSGSIANGKHQKTTSFENIETPGSSITKKFYSEVKKDINVLNKDDTSIEGRTLSAEIGLVGSAGAAGFFSAKAVNNIPARISRRKNVVPEQKAYSKLQKDIKVSNKQSKRNIKEAKRQYKDIKRNTKRKKGGNQTIKSAKNSYKSTKQAEKYSIKMNKKNEKKAIKKLKKAIARVKNMKLYAAIAAGVFAFVLMATLVSLLSSPLSIMFTDDDNDGKTYSIRTAISSLNTEFADVLKDIVEANPHDTLSISNYGCQYTVANWQDIFAVWDIKQLESSFVAVIEDEQYNEIRNVLWDMIDISSTVERYLVIEKDETGEDIEVEKKKLVISVEYLNVDEMAALYSFDSKQKKELKDLMKAPEFTGLFSSLALDVEGMGTPIVGSGQFMYPTISTTISAGYPYYQDGSYHGGIDFPVPTGSNVFAVDDGVVSTVRMLDNSYGYYIIISHGNGLSTLYGHNSKLLVEEGQTVRKGDVIALSGSTGNSTGPHCHFEVRLAGNRVNPFGYLS